MTLFTRYSKVFAFGILAALSQACSTSDSDSPSPTPSGSTTLKGTIKTDLTLTNGSGSVDYYIEEIVYVEAKITIEPGTVIVGKAGSGLYFDGSKGVLVANGTKASPIVFKSESGAKGGWLGMRFNDSNNPLNKLNYVTITDGGSASFDGAEDRKANIQFYGTCQIAMLGCSINNSANHGLYELSTSDLTLTQFDSNSFANNKEYPMYMFDQIAKDLGNTSTFTTNGKQFVGLYQKNFEGLPGAHTWKKQAVPYYWDDTQNLVIGYYTTNGNLTLEAGVELVMGPGSGIVVGDNSNDTGFLKMLGTATQKVTIRGSSSTKGDWKGIFVSTNSVSNNFTHASISDGGSANLSTGTSKANVVVDYESKLVMSNVSLSNSAGCGYTKKTSQDPQADVTATSMSYANNTGGNACTY